MQVIKIGGALFNKPSKLEIAENILRTYKNKNVFVVISAFGKTTRNLINAARIAETGNSTDSMQSIEEIVNFHLSFINESIKSENNRTELLKIIEPAVSKLKEYILGIAITHELSDRTLDKVMSYGEYFALKILFYYLIDSGFDIAELDSTNIIITDNTFGSAKPDLILTSENIQNQVIPIINKFDFILTQGFAARYTDGSITTMGIESSNLTATIYAALLGADELTIWSNVNGIQTADPALFKNTRTISNLNYKTALSIAANGLNLLYPEMIRVASENKIKINIRSAYSVDGAYTVISETDSNLLPIIIVHKNIRISTESNERKCLKDSNFLTNIILPDKILNAISDKYQKSENILINTDYIIISNINKNKISKHALIERIFNSNSFLGMVSIKNNNNEDSQAYDIHIFTFLEEIKEILEEMIK